MIDDDEAPIGLRDDRSEIRRRADLADRHRDDERRLRGREASTSRESQAPQPAERALIESDKECGQRGRLLASRRVQRFKQVFSQQTLREQSSRAIANSRRVSWDRS